MEIQYFNRQKGLLEVEKVYGDKAINWLYDSVLGKSVSGLLSRRLISSFYGNYQNLGLSKGKINRFVSEFNIDLSEFKPATAGTTESPYPNFNSFFIREFKDGLRSFPEDDNLMGAPCEARYFAYDRHYEDQTIPVKGNFLSAKNIIQNERWYPDFKDGPILLARLCPVDYHRFHFPDSGKLLDSYRISGAFHSVNPLALKARPSIFIENERHVSILETENFGKIAYVEVGAMMVGKIVQSYKKSTYLRGEEKGYFLFGGSTVIAFGEPGRWSPDQDIINQTNNGVETLVNLGKPIASRL